MGQKTITAGELVRYADLAPRGDLLKRAAATIETLQAQVDGGTTAGVRMIAAATDRANWDNLALARQLDEAQAELAALRARVVPEGWEPRDLRGPNGVHVVLNGSEGYRVTGHINVRVGRDLGLAGRHWDDWREAINAVNAAPTDFNISLDPPGAKGGDETTEGGDAR